MGFRHDGNGHTKTEIDFIERPGYVLICPRNSATPPANIALIVNAALTDWLKKTPNIRVRTVLPITRDGQTTAVHLWYDSPDSTG
jgi:hypothetical protein